ncbi:MAG: hypothetical protein AAF297_10495 [Planctomycetota bacterium]
MSVHTRTWHRTLGPLMIAAACTLAACTSAPVQPTFGVEPGASTAEVRSRLAQLAQAEAGSPPGDLVSIDAFAAGLAVAGRSGLGPEAEQSIDAMLDAFTAEPLVSSPPPPKGALSDLDRRAALAAYARGREALIRLDPQRAISELEQATALDPDSAHAWRSLAEAQITLGLRASAMVSFERAIALGLDEPRALTLAGIDALNRRQTDRASRLLARAERSPVPDADPGLEIVRRAAMGEAALERGRLLAGAQLIASAIASPPQLTSPTRVAAELGAVFRRRPELWLRAGDAFATTGRVTDADEAYGAAMNLPGSDTPAIAARRLALALESGRPALAAGLLYERFTAAEGLITTRDVRLISAMTDAAPQSEAVIALRDGIAALIEQTSDPTPTERLSLVRGYAAAQPLSGRARTLLTALADDALAGPDAQRILAADLFASGTDDPESTAERVSRAVETAPFGALDIVRTAIERSAVPLELVESLAETKDALLIDAAAVALGRPRNVDTSPSRTASTPSRFRLAHAALLAEAAASTGRWADARAHRELLTANDLTVALLRTQLAAQLFDEAAETARQIAAAPDAPAWQLLVASDGLRLVGELEEAADLADRALELDPLSEPAFERVLALRGVAGPAADRATADRVAADLRTRRPTSRLLRMLVAQELIRRQLSDEARLRIEELAAEDPLDPGLLDQQIALVRLETSNNRSADAIVEAIRASAEKYPGSLPAARALAVVLAQTQQAEAAAAAIQATIDATGTRALDRVLERVLRNDGRADDADSKQTERLIRTPRSIDETLEVAALQAGGQVDWATESARPTAPAAVLNTLRTGVPDAARLTQAQRANASLALVRTIARVPESRQTTATPDEQESADQDDRDALALISWAADRGVEMAPGLHGRRVALLGRTGATTDTLADAVRTAVAQHPSISAELLASTIGALNGARREIDAATLIADLFLLSEPPYPESLRPDFFRAIFSLIAASGDPEGGRILIDRLHAADRVSTVLDVVNFRPEGAGQTDPRADFAYNAAIFANATEGDQAAEPLFRLALAYQADHVWSANDLGYSLLERGEKLEDAERLITLAAVNAPDQHNIIDSLGWLRYHQGKLSTPDGVEDDDLARLGAVDLLRRAVEILEAQVTRSDDGVIADHLGDALARAGQLDEARVAWLGAREQANSRLRSLNLQQQTETPVYRRISSLARAISLKIQRAERGEMPETPEPRFVPPAPN